MASAATPAAAHSQAPHQTAVHVVLTNADNGRTVPARTGDDIDVTLTGYREDGLTYSWSRPVSDSTGLRRTAGGTNPRGGATARFHVEKDGVATLSAGRHCRPDAGHLCPLVVTPWKVRVEVK
ncbi:hypothetical protein [Streptomyces sp. MMG1121]|uniref:hypothetical protein n=1 Tax=Streptomyces sp. MMG1121 TaxID=1415544 RepID=UPI0006AE2540|nr:hypothetical protein [Streptomyces sp. MMG1121]KOV66378.1 hypothetical protein ADK64_12700 [Streptomyces sp. MMG1121]